jgi:hypothetical protein
MFSRKCKCGKEIFYKAVSSFRNAEKKKSLCKSCGISGKPKIKLKNFSRNCPDCACLIWYNTNERLILANEKNILCSSCNKKGDKNPFYGKTHSLESIKKMSESTSLQDRTFMQSAKYKDKMKIINNQNNKTYFDYWVEKYGLDEANRLNSEKKMKNSIASTGARNPMFGKPSPNGSGNGWQGWYKGWRFRSLKELSFVINYLEKNNIRWESAEKKQYMIKYLKNGVARNYYPDFFLPDEKCLVECKPKKLFNSQETILKKEAAEIFCKDNGYSYELIDPIKIEDDVILKLYLQDLIQFDKRYDLIWRQKWNIQK